MKFGFFVVHVIEVRNVQSAGLAVVIANGGALQLRKESGDAGAADLIHDVVPENAARIGEAALVGIQKQPRIFVRGSGQDHNACFHLHGLFRKPFDVGDAAGASFRIRQYMAGHGIAADRDVVGSQCRRQRNGHGVEHGAHVTTVDAVAAVMAGRPVVEHAGQLSDPARRGAQAQLLTAASKMVSAQFSRIGRQELAIGKLRHPASPGDADEAFDAIVIGRDVGVGNGPVIAIAIARSRFELEVRHTAGRADQCSTPAQNTRAGPAEGFVGRRGVRILAIVDHDPVVEFRRSFEVLAKQPGFAPGRGTAAHTASGDENP